MLAETIYLARMSERRDQWGYDFDLEPSTLGLLPHARKRIGVTEMLFLHGAIPNNTHNLDLRGQDDSS